MNFENYKMPALKELGKKFGIAGAEVMKKAELVAALEKVDGGAPTPSPVMVESKSDDGFVDIVTDRDLDLKNHPKFAKFKPHGGN